MKKSILLATLCAGALAVSLTACGGSQAPAQTTGAAAETTASVESMEGVTDITENVDETMAISSVDVSEPDHVIASGDFAGIEALAKAAQNFEVQEGETAQIGGILSTDTSVPAIQEPKDDGSYVGISMYVDGDWEVPANGTDLEVTGHFVQGQYFMEFHVNPADIVIE